MAQTVAKPSRQYRTVTDYVAARLWRRAGELAPLADDAYKVRQYANDPIGFARNICGVEPWSKQELIIRAILQHRRVSVVSGHKVGKSLAFAILALWFYCTYPGARVVITAVTDRQVNGIIWREIKMMVARAKRVMGITIPGAENIHEIARSGLTDPVDFSEIRGYTAREAEAIAGVSGAHLLYLVDEASGVADKIFEAIDGNRAAGAYVVLASNPTRATGEFYESHTAKQQDSTTPNGYHTIHIDSRESPNITGEYHKLRVYDAIVCKWVLRTQHISGLAGQEWVDEKLREWGEESPLFKIRVAGLFCAAEDLKIFSTALLIESVARRETVQPSGRLFIGVDPAGPSTGGDESAFAPRRGAYAYDVIGRTGLTPEAHVSLALQLIVQHNDPACPEKPIIVIDPEGPVGTKVYAALEAESIRSEIFELAVVRSSNGAVRQPKIYDRIRDELWANAAGWVTEGGTIPENVKLLKDLNAPEYYPGTRGRLKVTSKIDLKKALGRSTDFGDAFCLACWEPLALRQAEPSPPPAADPYEEETLGALSPYDEFGYRS